MGTISDQVVSVLDKFGSLEVLHRRTDPARPALNFASDLPIHPALRQFLSKDARYSSGLWRHQGEAISHALKGRDVVVTTPTASGKSLVYALPIVQAALENRSATALAIFPTRALTNDQLTSFKNVFAGCGLDPTSSSNWIEKYDSSTPGDYRKDVRANARAILTNPDMLHVGILNNHGLWAKFFANLKYVVIDEAHEYRGVFGTNVAFLIRRLLSICALYGSKPQFICATATAENAQEHVAALLNRNPVLVSQEFDGSPRGERNIFLCKPKPGQSFVDAAARLTAGLVDHNLGTICFLPSRVSAETRMAALKKDRPTTASRMAVYRAGLSSVQRETTERALKDGKVKGVLCTTALELGIDIGLLDVALLAGFPSTMMSMWQRAGRVGRAGKEGVVIVVAGDNLLDSYFASHPAEFFARSLEHLYIHLGNESVGVGHYACLKKELADAAKIDDAVVGAELAQMAQRDHEGKLDDSLLFHDNPHGEVSIRSGRGYIYKLFDGAEEIGEIDHTHLLREAYDGATYYHGGEKFKVLRLLQGEKKIILKRDPAALDTRPIRNIKLTRKRAHKVLKGPSGALTIIHGDIVVEERTTGYYEVHEDGSGTGSTNGIRPLTNTFPTLGTSFDIQVDALCRDANTLPPESLLAGVHAVEHMFLSLVPVMTPCDGLDLSSDHEARDAGTLSFTIFDNVYGGAGICETAYQRLDSLCRKALEIVSTCQCKEDTGCPHCIQAGRCAYYNENLSKSVATSILVGMTELFDRHELAETDFTNDRNVGEQAQQSPRERSLPTPPEGARVLHKFFGEGRVTSVQKSASNKTRVVVDFGASGTKTLDPSYVRQIEASTAQTRECPSCHGRIPVAAVVCSVCGTDLTAG